jgi:hypothetical protein
VIARTLRVAGGFLALVRTGLIAGLIVGLIVGLTVAALIYPSTLVAYGANAKPRAFKPRR